MITSNSAMRTAHASIAARLSQHFHIVERRSTLRTEVVGGITTFAVMAYIIFLNPFVLTLNGSGRAEHVASFAGLATATCLAAAMMTIAMGWYTNYPFALAPSLEISTVLAADLIATHALSWQGAMGCSLWAACSSRRWWCWAWAMRWFGPSRSRSSARLAWASACCC
jgi:xanthine/uracil/vitamin C permease (AzgA family)